MIQFSNLKRKVRGFARATGANVAMMFALSLLPLAIAAGAGLDYAHAMMIRANMMDALDAAALAVGSQVNNKSTDFNKLAQDVFNANYKGPGHPTVTPDFGNQSVKVTGADNVATTALAMAGMSSISISASSMVVWGQTKLWVSLVLDNTGSMTQTDSTGLSKIAALKDASHQLLDKLQAAAASGDPGDVQVAIIPFAKDVNVGTDKVSASWIDWTDWSTAYDKIANASKWGYNAPSSTDGPGTNCPLTLGCVTQPGGTTRTSKIPSSGTYKGYICPDTDTSSHPGQTGHYYPGCYNSVATQTATTTNVKVVPVSVVWNCNELLSDLNKTTPPAPTCTKGSSSDGTATSNQTDTVYTNGYTGDSGPTTTSNTVAGVTYTETNKTGKCSGNPQTCKWTRTYTDTRTDTTVTAVAYNFAHTWMVNDHSLWKGCVMDRVQDDDTTFATPGNKFPAENNDSCNSATVMPLNYRWTKDSSGSNDNLSAKIDSMVANGGTNQTIGLAHGMQIQMTGDPYNAPSIPANTTRYIILLSDGLNTMDRWYGDGSNQSTQVDARMAKACKTAKDNGFVVYTLFVDLNGAQGNSQVLQNCATDTSKYYDLKKSSDIVTAFNDIAQKITNLRVSH